jgi:type IV pilus assembly protein PilA
VDRRRSAEEQGFTLIELMVVVVIIAALMAVAIPSFLTAERRAHDRQAQLWVRAGYLAETVHFLGETTPSYTGDAAVLTGIEPSIEFRAGTPSDTGPVYVSVDGATVYVAAKSRSGHCYYLRQDPRLGTVDFFGDDGCAAPSDGFAWRARW